MWPLDSVAEEPQQKPKPVVEAPQAPAPVVPLAEISFPSLDVGQALSFNVANSNSFGYVTRLIIAGREIKPDLAVVPAATGLTSPASVAGALTSFQLKRGGYSPITFQFTLSSANAEFMRTLVATVPADNIAPIDFSFVLYSYDPLAKRWFVACTGVGSSMLDAAAQNSGPYRWAVDATPYAAVQSPPMVGASITCIPQDTPQKIALRTSATAEPVSFDW